MLNYINYLTRDDETQAFNNEITSHYDSLATAVINNEKTRIIEGFNSTSLTKAEKERIIRDLGHYLIKNQRHEVIREIRKLELFSNEDSSVRDSGIHPLLTACKNGNLERISQLLIIGTDINAYDNEGNNAAHYLLENISSLVSQNNQINKEDLRKSIEALNLLLLQSNFKVSIPNRYNQNALGKAIKCASSYLAKKGCQRDIFNELKKVVSNIEQRSHTHSLGASDQVFASSEGLGNILNGPGYLKRALMKSAVLSFLEKEVIPILNLYTYIPSFITAVGAIYARARLYIDTYNDGYKYGNELQDNLFNSLNSNLLKTDLRNRCMIGSYFIDQNGRVITGETYKTMLIDHPAYTNAERGIYSTEEFFNRSLTESERESIADQLLNSALRIQEDISNSFAKNTQFELNRILDETRRAYDSQFASRGRSRSASICKTLFDKCSIETYSHLFQADSQYMENFYKIYRNSKDSKFSFDLDTRLKLEKIHEALHQNATLKQPSKGEIDKAKKLFGLMREECNEVLTEHSIVHHEKKAPNNLCKFYSLKLLNGLGTSVGKNVVGNCSAVASVMALDQARQYGADTALGFYFLASNIDTYKVMGYLASSTLSITSDCGKFIGARIGRNIYKQCEKFASNLFNRAKNLVNGVQEKTARLLVNAATF